MKIIEETQDSGSVFIRIESNDDLWYLKNIISEGDYVRATTYRRQEKKEDMERQKETSRIPVTVGIKVEKTEFQEFSNNLRILGVVVDGAEDLIGKHQSMIFSQDDNLVLKKAEWSDEQKKMLKEANRTKFSETLFFLTIDDEGADLFLIRGYGLQNIGHVESHKQGKDFDVGYSDKPFLDEVSNMINRAVPENSILVILGPGFERTRFETVFNQANVRKIKVYNFPANRPDEGAVLEFLQSGASISLLSDIRMRKDITLVNDFLRHLKTDGLATYGYDQISRAIDSGAVDILLISETKFRTEEGKALIKKAEEFKASIHVVSDSTEQGNILRGFGGYCAILRFNP